jgi:multiple sugar transport system permease protein
MVSASFMAPGEASNFPPPLLPAGPHAGTTTRELFAAQVALAGRRPTACWWRCWPRLLSLAFNLSAGLRLRQAQVCRPRAKLFKLLLGALVIPGQVTMMPLFLLLKHMGLVNTYAGALVPWLASIFGHFPGAAIRAGHSRRHS